MEGEENKQQSAEALTLALELELGRKRAAQVSQQARRRQIRFVSLAVLLLLLVAGILASFFISHKMRTARGERLHHKQLGR